MFTGTHLTFHTFYFILIQWETDYVISGEIRVTTIQWRQFDKYGRFTTRRPCVLTSCCVWYEKRSCVKNEIKYSTIDHVKASELPDAEVKGRISCS